VNEIVWLINELFLRSMAGVFAFRQDGMLSFRTRPKSSWPLNLGLAVRLQHATIQPVLRPQRERDVQSVGDLTGTYATLDPEQHDTATTDHLLAELYRRAETSEWVLGLWRPRKFRGHWSGLCWNGSPLICAGLASTLVADLGKKALAARDEQRPEGEGLVEDLEGLMGPTLRNAENSRPCRTYMAGLCGLAAVHAGTYGDEGDPGTDDDLAAFVRID
jgi:hypothetical protein